MGTVSRRQLPGGCHRHRKEPAESRPDTDRTAAESDTPRLLALLEQDLQTMREQLAAKDAEVLALRQQPDGTPEDRSVDECGV